MSGELRSLPGPRELFASAAVRERITLTLPVLNAARSVLFLVSGAEKRPILQKVLRPAPGQERRYPAQLVRPAGELQWLADFPLD